MYKSLTPNQHRMALGLFILIKEKQCGKIKGRTVADGLFRRDDVLPEDATSPTVSVEALLLTYVIYDMEERKVTTADISRAFL